MALIAPLGARVSCIDVGGAFPWRHMISTGGNSQYGVTGADALIVG